MNPHNSFSSILWICIRLILQARSKIVSLIMVQPSFRKPLGNYLKLQYSSSKNLKHLCAFPLPQCWFGYYSGLSAPKNMWLNIGEGEATFQWDQKCQESGGLKRPWGNSLTFTNFRINHFNFNCVLPLSIMPFTVLPFSSWYLYESGFFSVSFLYCGLEPIVGIFFASSLQLKNIIIYNHTYFSQTHYYIWVNTLFFPTDNLASFLVFLWICLETRCLPGHFHSQVAWQNTELFLPIVVHSLRR